MKFSDNLSGTMESDTISKNGMNRSAKGADVKLFKSMMSPFKISIAALICGAVFIGCDGSGSSSGGGGKAPKSGLSTDGLLGAIPAIYADYNLAEKAADEANKVKIQEVKEKGDINKLMNESAKQDREAKERRAKRDADLDAERAKVDGKDVPFTCSKAFEQLGIKVVSVKISASGGSELISSSFVANKDLELNYKNRRDYEGVHFKALAKDGSVIAASRLMLGDKWNTKFIAKGESLRRDGDGKKETGGKEPALVSFINSKNPEIWANFAGLEFITNDESTIVRDQLKNQ